MKNKKWNMSGFILDGRYICINIRRTMWFSSWKLLKYVSRALFYFLGKSKHRIYILSFFWQKKLLMRFLSPSWLFMYFYQVMCAIILLVLEPYLQVTLCSVYHVESFLKGLHSRFVFTGLQMLPYSCILL